MTKAWVVIKDRFRLGKRCATGRTVGMACFALCLLSFAVIVDSLSEKGTLYHLDLTINAYMIKAATPGLTAFLGAITDFGSIYVVVVVAVVVGVILFIRKNWWRLLALFLAVGIGQAVLSVIKAVFQKPRPETDLFVFSYSFPSGHVFSATVIYGFCIYVILHFSNNTAVKWPVSALLVLLILTIGFSRMYLGVHWFSDILAGHTTGLAWLLLCIFVAKKVGDR